MTSVTPTAATTMMAITQYALLMAVFFSLKKFIIRHSLSSEVTKKNDLVNLW
jgi:hypothetical protein